MNNKKFFVAVKALLFCNDHFLIVQRSQEARGDHYYWELPGGRLAFGESPEQAIQREVLEETRLNIKIFYPINIWHFYKDGFTQVIGITYLCRSEQNQVILSKEHENYAWINYEWIDKYNIQPSLKSNIETWNWKKMKDDILKL